MAKEISTVLWSLRQMNEIIDSERLYEILESFYCTKDKDIQNFLRTKALDYEIS